MIFGVTGGVTEAVIRRLVPGHGNAVMDSIAEAGMRGEEGIKEFSITYEGKELNICVASGLANARKVMEQVQSGEKQYHLIEIMACRRGCIMGGGQQSRQVRDIKKQEQKACTVQTEIWRSRNVPKIR